MIKKIMQVTGQPLPSQMIHEYQVLQDVSHHQIQTVII